MKIAIGLLCSFCFVAFGQNPPPPQTTPGTPPTAKPQVTLPPQPQGQPSKAPPPERDTQGDYISIMPFYWATTTNPVLAKSHGATVSQAGDYDFQGNRKYAFGGVLTLPTGHENSLQFTYFRKQNQGNQTIPADEVYFGTFYPKNDVVAAHYTLQAFKLSWNYLTYPYPSAGSKFRFKTLWEVQGIWMNSSFDAPADTNTNPVAGRKTIILPTLGLGIEYHPSKRVMFEAKGSGFGIVHHADIWDTEADLAFRASKIEVIVGGKAFHFKTSPHGDNYFTQTLYGPFAGIRYIFK